jgi:hypothetical protein
MTTDKMISALRQIQALVNEALREGPTEHSRKPAQQKVPRVGSVAPMSFDTNILAFMKKHAKGLSGPKKFTLLLARMAKGSLSAQVPYKEIEAQWNNMTTVLGSECNPAHGNRAKAAGWVDWEKGRWKLTAAWKEALAQR